MSLASWTARPLVACLGAGAILAHAQLSRDESVLFLPTVAWKTSDATGWEAALEGHVFEQEPRRLTLLALQASLGFGGIAMTEAQAVRFRERARFFLVDHERSVRLTLTASGSRFQLPPSAASGHLACALQLPASWGQPVSPEGRPRPVTLSVEMPRQDPRRFTAEVFLLPDRGVSVVSDIDDTLKITEVTDRRALLTNTFLEPFRVVPGMARLCRGWAEQQGAAFHYLSGSPWPLYPALIQFARTNGFPEGSWHLRDFAWKEESLVGLAESPVAHKQAVLGQLLDRLPQRLFLLLGDSGEQDPEVYGEVAVRHPRQVLGILIREVTQAPASSPRYSAAFRGLPGDRWAVFREPAEAEARAAAWLGRRRPPP